jgi:hypothetical protein
MTRTPTNSVTAIAIAARAFAWEISPGARLAGRRFQDLLSVMPPPQLSLSQ